MRTGQISDVGTVVDKAMAREAQGSTGVGMGIVIPHSKSAGANSPMPAFVRITDGIDWNSLDGAPANLIFLISVPEADAGTEHLKILAALSRALVNKESAPRCSRRSLRRKSSISAPNTCTEVPRAGDAVESETAVVPFVISPPTRPLAQFPRPDLGAVAAHRGRHALDHVHGGGDLERCRLCARQALKSPAVAVMSAVGTPNPTA